MIKIVIQLNELETIEGKKAGRITCQSNSFDPVGDEEVWLRDRIFKDIEDIAGEIGNRAGSVVSITNLPLGRGRRNIDDKPRRDT
jgi:hypothetical protein